MHNNHSNPAKTNNSGISWMNLFIPIFIPISQNGKFGPKRLKSEPSAIELVRGRATVRTKPSVPDPRTKQECILMRGHSKCIMHVPAKFNGLSLFLHVLEGKHLRMAAFWSYVFPLKAGARWCLLLWPSGEVCITSVCVGGVGVVLETWSLKIAYFAGKTSNKCVLPPVSGLRSPALGAYLLTVPLGKLYKHLSKATWHWDASAQLKHRSLKPWGFAPWIK